MKVLNNPYLSIIIPTLNEEDYLRVLLECLKTQTFQDFEVIVADAGSKDNTRLVAESFKAKVVKGGLPGEGRNNGARVAKGKLLMFVDADVTFSKNFLKKALSSFNKRNLDMANFLYDLWLQKPFYTVYSIWWNILQLGSTLTPKPMGLSQCLLIKHSLFIKTGGYKSNLYMAEDQILTDQAIKNNAKFRVILNPIRVSPRRYEAFGYFKVAATYTKSNVLRKFPKNASKISKQLSDSIGGYGKW